MYVCMYVLPTYIVVNGHMNDMIQKQISSVLRLFIHIFIYIYYIERE